MKLISNVNVLYLILCAQYRLRPFSSDRTVSSGHAQDWTDAAPRGQAAGHRAAPLQAAFLRPRPSRGISALGITVSGRFRAGAVPEL
jgi:hypothetical protein